MPCSSCTTASPSAISPRSAERRRLAGARLAVRARAEDLLLGDQHQPVGGQREPAPQRSAPARPAARPPPRRTARGPAPASTSVARPSARSSATSRSACVRLWATTRTRLPASSQRAHAIAQRPADVDAVGLGVAARRVGARPLQLGAQRRVRLGLDADARRRRRRARVDARRPRRRAAPAARRAASAAAASSSPSTKSSAGSASRCSTCRVAAASRRRDSLPARLVDHRLGILDHAQRRPAGR